MSDPYSQGQDDGDGPDTEGADEQMLEQVRRGMGNEQGPPPGSNLKWQSLEDDQQALEDDPSPENVQAFVQYWGEENLPPDLQQEAQAPAGAPQGPGPGRP